MFNVFFFLPGVFSSFLTLAFGWRSVPLVLIQRKDIAEKKEYEP